LARLLGTGQVRLPDKQRGPYTAVAPASATESDRVGPSRTGVRLGPAPDESDRRPPLRGGPTRSCPEAPITRATPRKGGRSYSRSPRAPRKKGGRSSRPTSAGPRPAPEPGP
jgi:hypothetical protein